MTEKASSKAIRDLPARRRSQSRLQAQLHQRRHHQRRGRLFGELSVSRLLSSARPAVGAGVGERLITLNVNGQQRRVDVMKQETLAWTLRYKLGLTGTKLGCDRAECGSCTVLIDDVPHYSCSVLTHTVRGRKVVTIEGLAKRRRNAAPGTAGRHRRTGLSVRVLHVRLHYGYSGIPENQSQSHAPGIGARHLGKSVPLPGLRQDSDRDDARRREYAEVESWITRKRITKSC